jgi:hypothetical protein
VSTIVAPSVAPQEQTEEQRMSALKRANEIRVARSKLKKDLKKRRVTLSSVLLPEIDWCIETMRVFDLLIACPATGRVKAGDICKRLAVRPSVYLPQLSPARRQQLVEVVEGTGRSRSG